MLWYAISPESLTHRDFFELAREVEPDLTGEVISYLERIVGEYSRSLIQSLETATKYLYLKASGSAKNSDYHLGFLKLLQLLTEVLGGPKSLSRRFVEL
jgi:hypothetical protein